ncbi:MAG: hypothetical protein NVS2B16_14200 [Chloroflexota bacterium]
MSRHVSELDRTREHLAPTGENESTVTSLTEWDKEHTNVHYEQPPEFFYAVTGGEWNVYSCNLWSDATTDTESQEAKLDLLAQYMDLKPGHRILDVGCGWGGPLVYLSKKYGVRGVGLTLSSTQKRCAEDRIARYNADVEIVECHWQDYEDDQGFDAIFTDEVIVHFPDFGAFCAKAYTLLRPGGMFVNKELHFTTSRYKDLHVPGRVEQLSRSQVFIHDIYGQAGCYRTLGEELSLLDKHGFAQLVVDQLDRMHYYKTADRWLTNMQERKDELQALVGQDYFRRFRTYLKIVRGELFFRHRSMTIDVVVSQKL